MFQKQLMATATLLATLLVLATYAALPGSLEPCQAFGGCVPVLLSHTDDQDQRTSRPESPPLALLLEGKVEDVETKRPIAGATVLVHRLVAGLAARDAPRWAGDTTIKTDDRGHFKLVFPSQQVADSRVHFSVRISHPDHVPRASRLVSLAELDYNRRFGDRPSLGIVRLERGIEYTARVVTPEGTPAAGVDCEFSNSGGIPGEQPFGFHSDDFKCRTDDRGSIRLRMPGGASSLGSLRTTPTKTQDRARVAAGHLPGDPHDQLGTLRELALGLEASPTQP